MCKNKLVSKSDLPTEQSELGWSPELLSLATQPAMPPRLPISTSKCYGRVSPQPQRATKVHSSWGPLCLQSCSGVGETESEWQDARGRPQWGGQMQKALAPQAPGRSQRKRGEPPARPRTLWGMGQRGWEHQGGGKVPGEAGLQFFMEEASGGLASGGGGPLRQA